MKREAGRILPRRSWCSRCSRPASNSARRLSFCLPACHPVCQFSRDREAEGSARRWARRCRGGTGEISGAQALPVKSDMTFWFCHLSPTAMSESALRSACHPPLPPSASVSFTASRSHSVSFLILLFLPELQFYGWKCGGVTFRGSWAIIGRFHFRNLLFMALNEGRCQDTRRLDVMFFGRWKNSNRINKSGDAFVPDVMWYSNKTLHYYCLGDKTELLLRQRTI